jgi:AraC-like DNA-binding protein
MEEIKIPDAIFEQSNSDVQIFDYKSSSNIDKQLINLTKHTFSFLIEGQKEVIGHKNFISAIDTSFLLMQKGRCIMTEKLSSSNNQYRSILLFFSNNIVLDLIKKYDFNIKKGQFQKSVFSFDYDDYLKNYLKNIVEISKLPNKTQGNLLAIKLEEILIYLVEKNGSDFITSLLEDNNQKSRKLISVVETHKFNKLSIKELAFLCNMSISTFKREFTKQYQLSPIKWFQDQRLEYASVLLTKENKRPSDIYIEVGYENLSSFIQAFKSKFGQTPKQFQ